MRHRINSLTEREKKGLKLITKPLASEHCLVKKMDQCDLRSKIALTLANKPVGITQKSHLDSRIADFSKCTLLIKVDWSVRFLKRQRQDVNKVKKVTKDQGKYIHIPTKMMNFSFQTTTLQVSKRDMFGDLDSCLYVF